MIYTTLSQKYPGFINFFEQGISSGFSLIRSLIHKRKEGAVVVIALHRLGDSVFTLKAIDRLRKYYGEKMVLFTYQENLPIYKLVFPDISFVTISKDEFISNRIAKSSARKKLNQLKPAYIIDLTGSIITASLLFNSSAKEITGITKKPYKGIYTKFVKTSYAKHLSDIYLNVCDEAGIPKSSAPINCTDSSGGERSFLIFPSAGWEAKEWPLNKFLAAAKELQKKYRVSIILQKGAKSNDIINEIIDQKFRVKITASIEEMIAEVMKHSDIICNDSGPSHVAELLGKRNITLFGSTNPSVIKPENILNTIVMNRMKCSPEGTRKLCLAYGGLQCPSNECLKNLTVEKVLAGVTEQSNFLTKS